ncbi:MAG TPA: heparan-alpha-glucosaminide N-acetyltransferase domain-containing protein [Chitinophagaceae bacterium]|nr:heparan-alpha-glucosaminide N-acetyltransferase domain-containing protein [Chitinophagaceae bacterium]
MAGKSFLKECGYSPVFRKAINFIDTKFSGLNQRYQSLDVFRGATVALMILVNNPGSWTHIYAPLEHAPWHGYTPTDLVFPFFLFAVGNAMAFVMPRLEAAGTPAFLKKVLKRTILIFAIGLFLNWFPFVRWQDDELVFKPLSTLRIFGVLQRIALCYLFASLIVYCLKAKGAFLAGIAILMMYWFLSLMLGNAEDPFSLEGFWGTALDRNLLGENHLYKGEGVPFDPEGLASTLPAIVQVIFGFLAGHYIQKKGKTYEMLTGLFVYASILLLAGVCWGMAFPINKKIWTSSYVVFTTGLALNIIALTIYLIELRKYGKFPVQFFLVFGKNPLFIFVLSAFLPRLLGLVRIADGWDETGKRIYIAPYTWFYEHVCKLISTDLNIGSLFYAVCIVAFYWVIVYWLDRKKMYIRV